MSHEDGEDICGFTGKEHERQQFEKNPVDETLECVDCGEIKDE